MSVWETTKYSKWYNSHRRFSFTARHCIELYDEKQVIPDTIFKPFLKTLSCHSKAEEKMFMNTGIQDKILEEHSQIVLTKHYTNEEKYAFCKSLLVHMKMEEEFLLETLSQAPTFNIRGSSLTPSTTNSAFLKGRLSKEPSASP